MRWVIRSSRRNPDEWLIDGSPLAVRQTTESSRLLYDDIQHDQYGSINGGAVPSAPVDAQDAQREEAALRRILAQTSEYGMIQFRPR